MFAWNSDSITLFSISVQAPPQSVDINIRKNASGGASADVPTWAAGAVILIQTTVNTLGVGITYHQFQLSSTLGPFGTIITHPHISQTDMRQVIVPFYDEPIFSFDSYNDLSSGLGTQSATIILSGFVRNV